jgi:hypothetical protein
MFCVHRLHLIYAAFLVASQPLQASATVRDPPVDRIIVAAKEHGRKLSMAIIVGDIHGNVEKTERFLRYRADQPHVALGDYVDSFTESFESQLQVVQLLTNSTATLLWGNHDLNYVRNAPWRSSGYQPQHAKQLQALFDELLRSRRLVAAHSADGWLCTHAGLAEGDNGFVPDGCDQDSRTIADCINEQFFISLAQNRTSPLFNIPVARGGDAPYGGIFWFDPFREKTGLAPVCRQIFGHTEQKTPVVTDRWICLDTTNADDIWVFDTASETLVNLMEPHEIQDRQARRFSAGLVRLQEFSGF